MNGHFVIDTPVTRLSDLGHGTGCVALTFDDGPQPPWTDRILDVLEDTGTPATFFVLGSQIRGNEPTLRRMADLGCGIEVHAWDHIRMTEQDPDRRRLDIDRTRRLIRDVTGREPSTVRPPFGHISEEVLGTIQSTGLTAMLWSVHARDWAAPGPGAIERDVGWGLGPVTAADAVSGGIGGDGAVILLHDGGGDRSRTVAAVPGIIRAINDRGLRAVSTTDLARR